MNDRMPTIYFGMELFYDKTETSSLGNAQMYNGNIGAIKWKNAGVASGVGNDTEKA